MKPIRVACRAAQVLGCLALAASPGICQVAEAVSEPLRLRQYDLQTEGRAFLLKEAAGAAFFMLGELHGDNEIPRLIREIWPPMCQMGYRHIAAEISPWAADRLLSGPRGAISRMGSWTAAETAFVNSFHKGGSPVLWGCDMEEMLPHLLIRDLAAVNPGNQALRSAVEMTKSGYRRSAAPELLRLLQEAQGVKDVSIRGVSLRSNILSTLEVEVHRLSADSRLRASIRRETLMKELFHQYWQTAAKPKVLLRFGRNHLHRGYDRRGVSTLGNFLAELAAAQGVQTFNLAAFGAGGKIFWAGQLLDWDERKDDPAFEFLASLARFPATVFDLRPIRQALHRIPESKRSPVETSLVYWADSYDAILCYREVTAMQH